MFVQSFFKIQLKYPVFNKLLILSALIAGIFSVFAIFTVDPCFFCGGPFPTSNLIYSILASITVVSILIIFFLYAREKNKFNKLVIIGGSPLIIVWIIGFLLAFGILSFAYYKYGVKIDWTWVTYFRPVEVASTIWFIFFFSAHFINALYPTSKR